MKDNSKDVLPDHQQLQEPDISGFYETISMEDQLRLAKFFLSKRGIRTLKQDKNTKKILKEQLYVISVSEVLTILELLQRNEFWKFYRETKDKAGKFFP